MVTLFLLLVSVALHEMAHALAAVARGLKVKGVVVSWRGVGVRREAGSTVDGIWIAAAGPAINLALALLFWRSPAFRAGNLMLAFVNLLPLPHADGRRILTGFIAQLRVNNV